MLIQVTQTDIDRGKPSDCKHCPIAEAALRAFPGFTVDVGWTKILVYPPASNSPTNEYDLPEIAVRFISDFDALRPVKPFTFEIDHEPSRRVDLKSRKTLPVFSF